MAKERPWLLVRALVTVVAGFALLGRDLLHDELVSSRYFLFPLAVAMILPAYGVEFVVARIRLAPKPKWTLAAVLWMTVLSSSVLISKAAYSRQYAFQDEYSFLRKALHELPDGCVVYQLNVRSDDLERDVDCCLDAPRTPLPVVYPKLQFRHLRPADLTGGLDFGTACVAYYESSACAIDVAQSAEPHWIGAMNHFRKECPIVHTIGTLKPVSQATVSSVSTNGFFEKKAPTVTLYRWTK
jgi:hypothetical protein